MTTAIEPRAALGYNDVVQLLARFTYKPNFTIGVVDAAPTPIVRLTMYVPDALRQHQPVERIYEDFDYRYSTRLMCRTYFTGERYRHDVDLIPVTGTRPLPAHIYDESRFWYWLRQCLIELETHELDEWFRVDGCAIYDPHTDDNI